MSTYREKSRKSDFESFANKIFTGIKELIPEYAEKRAIWELFQNALDVIEKNGIIIIEKTVIGFKFSHNGKPFKDDNIGALIKQYSSGKTYGDNGEEVGQYGTGFISTHVYGKNIKINGNIKLDDGTYRDLENFNLIRNSTSPELLTLELLRQDDYISDLCDNIEKKIEFPQNNITSFEYIASEINKSSINKMFEYIHTVLPYIFCFTTKLDEVIVKENTNDYIYKKISNENNQLILLKNSTRIVIDYLSNTDKSIKIVTPQKNNKFNELPRLFLYYPLLDTIETGINFLIHARDFKPNKERDFLLKQNNNEEVKNDVERNKGILEDAFDLINKKVLEDDNVDFIEFVKVSFVDSDVEFEKSIKQNYINIISRLERINVAGNQKRIEEINFFDSELLEKGDDFLKSFD